MKRKILIDTNIYLDFYRSNKDALKLFDELVSHYESIILTDQIIQEFERSREKVIKTVIQNFESESKLENFSSSFLQNINEFKELIEIQRKYKSKKTEVNKAISEILNDPSKDPIATFFNEFVNESLNNERILYTTDVIVEKAKKRKLVGNPPTSDKYSIGDEINWEIILANVKEDIIIVGRDNTYNDNFSFLKKDFHKNTGHFIISLTDSITKALKEIGIETSDELKKAENSLIDDLKHSSEFWKPTG